MTTLLEMQYDKIHDLRPKIAISFSGGRTSAVMTKMLLDEKKESHNIVVVFANTGCEHEGTLQFVRDCDLYWDFNTVWLEADVIMQKGIGIRHKIVSFETASRNGEPYEAAIKKYGMFNQTRPGCTGFLKRNVIDSYLKSIGFIRGKKINFETAIGIRADEIDRISVLKEKKKYIYPLVEKNFTKQMVIDFMKKYPFDLKIPENLGNCTWCWKKSLRTLATIAQDYPESFDFPKRMEETYGPLQNHAIYKNKREDGKFTFFRDYHSVNDIFKLAQNPNFKRLEKKQEKNGFDFSFDDFLDKAGSCSETCEGYETDGT